MRSKWVRAAAELIDNARPALVTIPGVELLEVGQNWQLSTGVVDFTPEDLAACVASQDDPAVRTPVLKLGHTDLRFYDAQPSFGRIEHLRLTNNGMTLVGDLVGVPLWLADIMPSAYPRRSIEGKLDATTETGNTWPMVLTGLALLGDAYPAISTLEDIKAVFPPDGTPPVLHSVGGDVEEVAASDGNAFRAMRMEDMPNWLTRKTQSVAASEAVAASVTMDQMRSSFYDSLNPDQYWWWIREILLNPMELIVDTDEGALMRVPVTVGADDTVTFGTPEPTKIQYVAASMGRVDGQVLAELNKDPATAGRPARLRAENAEVPDAGTLPGNDEVPNTEEEHRMDEAVRRALAAQYKLDPETATEADINAAILQRAQNPDPAGDASGDQGTADAETSHTEPVTPAPAPKLEIPEGFSLVDNATLEDLKVGVGEARELVASTRQRERNEYLDNAIRAGKFAKSRRDHYAGLMASDEVGARQIIDNLAAGLVPVDERGEVGGETSVAASAPTDYPDSWAPVVLAHQNAVNRVVVHKEG
jgi:hypothetical protein